MTTRRKLLRTGLTLVVPACVIALTGFAPTQVLAEVPPDLLRFVIETAEALSNGDPTGFLEKFDRDMPAYADLRERVEGLLAAYEVGSTVEIANDSGDEQSHMLELDWLLVLNERNDSNGRKDTRRQIIKCRAERKGKRWKFSSIEPIDFFRY
jgi:hypothetical protein